MALLPVPFAPASSRAARAARSNRFWKARQPGSATRRPVVVDRTGRPAKAIAFAVSRRISQAGRAQTARPAPAPPSAGASRPPGRALASRGFWVVRASGRTRTHGRGRNSAPPRRSSALVVHLRPYRQPPHPRDAAGSAADRGDQPPAPQAPEGGQGAVRQDQPARVTHRISSIFVPLRQWSIRWPRARTCSTRCPVREMFIWEVRNL